MNRERTSAERTNAEHPSASVHDVDTGSAGTRGANGDVNRERTSAERSARGANGSNLLQKHEAIHWHGYVNSNREALYGFMQAEFNHSGSGLGNKELYNITKTAYDPTLGYGSRV